MDGDADDDGTPGPDATPGDGEVVADLHTHTTASDGELPLAEVPATAKAAGLDWVAVTDHDRVHDGLDEPVERRDGVAVVRGVELRVESPAGRVDLLGYAVDPTPALTAELERIQRDRVERGAEIVRRVEERLGVDLDVEPAPGIGRPHIARAIAASAADYDYDGAFEHLIGSDCPCYVPRDVPGFERGARLLRESCPVVGLAHPFRYPDPEAALALTADLDAVEAYYPYDRAVDPEPAWRAVDEHDLLATGGSDAHGREYGAAGLDADAFAPVRAALPDPA